MGQGVQGGPVRFCRLSFSFSRPRPQGKCTRAPASSGCSRHLLLFRPWVVGGHRSRREVYLPPPPRGGPRLQIRSYGDVKCECKRRATNPNTRHHAPKQGPPTRLTSSPTHRRPPGRRRSSSPRIHSPNTQHKHRQPNPTPPKKINPKNHELRPHATQGLQGPRHHGKDPPARQGRQAQARGGQVGLLL